MTMTLGQLGIAGIKFEDRCRFTFEGKDKDGNITFPQSFVKIRQRPSEKKLKFDVYGGNEYPKNCQNTASGSIKMYGGYGYLIEEWKFEDIKLEATDIIDHSITEYDVGFTIFYEKMERTEHVSIKEINKDILVKNIIQLREDLNGEYLDLDSDKSILDGNFSASQLRKVADLMDKLNSLDEKEIFKIKEEANGH